MKNYIIIFLVAIIGVTATAQDKNARATLEVDGICGMCKKRIETAAIKTKGVKSAVWNVETKECSLIFDENKTDVATISQSIANVGHDTKEIKATEEAYNSVHACCLYRDEKVQKDHDNN
ncbi:heavy-metal-associated domain-containing protein [Rasiella sp. SM2506]|uniref:heavy-metal-associated domain-containing protein n=1 Tax=Rasiella sp. SM2506 TaxID=3423914 RepID=UPI003D7B6DCA